MVSISSRVKQRTRYSTSLLCPSPAKFLSMLDAKASSIYSPSLEVKNKRAVLGLVDEVQSEEEVIVARSCLSLFGMRYGWSKICHSVYVVVRGSYGTCQVVMEEVKTVSVVLWWKWNITGTDRCNLFCLCVFLVTTTCHLAIACGQDNMKLIAPGRSLLGEPQLSPSPHQRWGDTYGALLHLTLKMNICSPTRKHGRE